MTRLTHIDEHGAARMVDVSAKDTTQRQATARGTITLTGEALDAIRGGTAKKGDVLAVARVAGIMAAKQVPSLIPLCHALPLSSATLDFELGDDRITITATIGCTGQTGVEMEALTAVSVALLTIYDMVKAIDRTMTIGDIRLIEKRGGKSSDLSAA